MNRNRHFAKNARRAASLLVCALGFSGAAPAQSIQDVMRDVKFEQRLNAQLPLDATFRDDAGSSVELREYFGKRPVVLAFVYYECPMLCTFVLNGLVKGLKPLKFDPGRDFDVVIISINPKETPALAAEKKAAYLKEYRRPATAAGWHFLTGDEAMIRRATETAGFRFVYDPASGEYAHASGLIVATPEGKLFRYFYGIEYAPRDLRFAMMEAAGNKLGSPVDQVLLYCFHYDPKTGKYGLLISRIIQLAGSATVLALGTFMFVMFRRDRRLQAGLAPQRPAAGV